jgi:hypothetical protein
MPKSSKIEKDSRIVGNYQTYRGIAPFPGTAVIGDIWQELNGSGGFLEEWIWNGTYWLSTKTFFREYSTIAIGTAVPNPAYPLTSSYNVFVTKLYGLIFSNVAATGSVNWGWSLRTTTVAGTATTIATANNNGQAANSWGYYETAVNTLITYNNPSRVLIDTLQIRTGTISAKGTVGYEYRKARI